MAKTISVVLSDKEENKLDQLVEFFQKKSISNVTRSDVIKYLINRSGDVLSDENLQQVKAFYLSMGIDKDFEVLPFNQMK